MSSLVALDGNMSAPCFSVALMLASWVLPSFSIPGVTLHIPGVANISHVFCSGHDLGSTFLSYSDTEMSLSSQRTTMFECRANFTAPNDPGELILQLEVAPMDVLIDITRGNTSQTQCEAELARVAACQVPLRLTNLSVTPPSLNWLWDVIFSEAESWINSVAEGAICDVVNTTLVQQLTNHTVEPPVSPPTIQPGLTSIGRSTLIVTLTNIIHSLPVLFDFLAIDIKVATPTSLKLELSVTRTVNISELPLGASSLGLVVPQGGQLSLEVWLKDFICDGPFACRVARNGGVTFANMRVRGIGEVNRLVDNFIGPALMELITSQIQLLVNASISFVAEDGYEYTSIELIEAEVRNQMPFELAVPLAAFLSAVAIAVIGYSASRHTHRPIVDAAGNAIPLKRVMLEDGAVVITCFCTMFLFAWSNSTVAAEVMVGDSYRLYTFSLRSTIDDLYSAGLYPLCVFITMFCGMYPYFKMLSIVVFSVILQRPQSRVLKFIDTCGKFSLLDTFMMIIMVTGLEVPGIASVSMLPSFYVFLVATFMSILVGNYATHGWRRESRHRMQPKFLMAEGGIPSPPASPLTPVSELCSEERVPEERRPWRGKLAVPALLLVAAGSFWAGFDVSLEYHLSGLGTIVSGTQRTFTLFQLFSGTSWPIYATGLFTVIIAPMLFAMGFPKSHVMGAWCATDTLLLACVGGLFQLTQFVKFVMGPALSPVYSASASLRPPLYGLLISMLIQWTLIAADIFQCSHTLERCVGSVLCCWRSLLNRSTAAADPQLGSSASLKGQAHDAEVGAYGSIVTLSETKRLRVL